MYIPVVKLFFLQQAIQSAVLIYGKNFDEKDERLFTEWALSVYKLLDESKDKNEFLHKIYERDYTLKGIHLDNYLWVTLI